MAPAQPPRAAGRAAMDAAGAAAAKLLRGWLSAGAGAREGALRILLSGVPWPIPGRACPVSCSPLFWPGCSRRRSESRPGRSPPPRGGSHCATLLPPKGGGARPTKGAGLQAAPPRAARGIWVTRGGWGLAPIWGDGGPLSLTGLRSLGRRRLPPNLRVTHSPASLANGIPGGSPTRAPRSLGPSELHLPPFGKAVPGSIGRPLCPSDPRAAPSLPRRGSEGLVGSEAAWRRGAPTWSAGGWGEAAEPGGWRVGVRRGRVPAWNWVRSGAHVCECACE